MEVKGIEVREEQVLWYVHLAKLPLVSQVAVQPAPNSTAFINSIAISTSDDGVEWRAFTETQLEVCLSYVRPSLVYRSFIVGLSVVCRSVVRHWSIGRPSVVRRPSSVYHSSVGRLLFVCHSSIDRLSFVYYSSVIHQSIVCRSSFVHLSFVYLLYITCLSIIYRSCVCRLCQSKPH